MTCYAQTDLVNRCLGGDASAWETVVDSHQAQIGRIVYRYAPLKSEVEDLKQEAFLRVYLGLKSFRLDSGNLRGWVIRIGRNVTMDRLRQTRHAPKCGGSEELESLNLPDHETASPERNAIRRETSRLLGTGLCRLSPELRQALILRYLKEMTYQEIAERLGIPDGTVKSRIKRGRDKLAAHLSRRKFK